MLCKNVVEAPVRSAIEEEASEKVKKNFLLHSYHKYSIHVLINFCIPCTGPITASVLYQWFSSELNTSVEMSGFIVGGCCLLFVDLAGKKCFILVIHAETS